MAEGKTFLVEHQHTDETCPSRTEEGMRMMADLVLGREHAARAGVRVLEDYLLLGRHRLLIFVQAEDLGSAERYADPFKRVGSVAVHEVGRCEAVMTEAMRELEARKAEA